MGQRVLSPGDSNKHNMISNRSPPTKGRKPAVAKRNLPDSEPNKGQLSYSKKTPPAKRLEILDSEEDDTSPSPEHDVLAESHITDLETALPPIKVDEAAIAEYEATRASQGEPLSPGETRPLYSSSIYVDAFNMTLDTILEEESYLFDETEMSIINAWKELDYQAQYLYVRLFLRKESAWHRVDRLRYHSDIADMFLTTKRLQESRDLPSPPEILGEKDRSRSPEAKLENVFTFADSSDMEITELEEAARLLSLDELKTLAKEAKIQPKNKSELLKSFCRACREQTSLDWATTRKSDIRDTMTRDESVGSPDPKRRRIMAESTRLERSDTVESTVSTASIDSETGLRRGKNREKYFIDKILAITGPCIRLSTTPFKLFERMLLVYYRSTEWTEKSLTTILLAKFSKRHFPDYVVCRSTNIFPTRDALLEFESAIRLQFRVDNVLEFNGAPSSKNYDEILDIFEEVLPRWKVLLAEEQQKEERLYDSGEGAYLRRFSPAWVYTRIIHKATSVLARQKQHEKEYDILCQLLDQRLFHLARRGAWYQRKALLEEHYMHALRPIAGIKDPEIQKRHWKRISLKTCEEGLGDRDCHVMFHYDLQKRVLKLEKNLKVAKREKHDFGHVQLSKSIERTVSGIQVQLTDTKPRGPEERQRSTRTIWIDEHEEGGECTVEEMCLSHYRHKEGYKGYHCEGGIIRTLFAYLFYDILFIFVPNVFQTAFQTCPLDLHTDAFYPSRISEINRRLTEISNGSAASLIRAVDAAHRAKETCVIGLNWSFSLHDLLEIAECFEGAALATVCKVMAQEYGQRGGGIPDLFLWRKARGEGGKGEVVFAEVKSENDRLSDTQRLWIHVLSGAGIRVELCSAVAREFRSRDV